jgi:hypothetical protein
MKNRIATLALVLVLIAVVMPLSPASAQDNSSTNPAAIGTRVRSMIELGSVYSNIYDIAVTVLETVRGKEAMTRLQAASPENKMPPEGFEYILARVKFELKGRAVSDNLTFQLGNEPLQWVALSSDLYEYKKTPVVVPKPALSGTVQPGSSMEGWLAFTVDKKDSGPVMVFDPDAGGATGRGRTLFFNLY